MVTISCGAHDCLREAADDLADLSGCDGAKALLAAGEVELVPSG